MIGLVAYGPDSSISITILQTGQKIRLLEYKSYAAVWLIAASTEMMPKKHGLSGLQFPYPLQTPEDPAVL